MLSVLAITTPIYAIVFIGFLATRLGLFARSDMRIFGRFVINLALPALIFRALSQRDIGEIFNAGYLLAYAAGSFAVIGLGYLWCRPIARLDSTAATFYVFGMACSNNGFVGYPILLLTIAPLAGVVLALNMMVENLLVIPFLLFMAERGRARIGGESRSLGMSLRRLLRNPLIFGLVAGFSISVLGVNLPAPIVRTVDLVASASSALSLIVIGGTLVGLPVRGIGLQVAPIVVGKLLLHPLLVFAAVLALPMTGLGHIDPVLGMAAVLSAGMPVIGIYAALAQEYGQEEFCAVALLLATVGSFFTLSALLWVFRTIPVFS